MSPPKMLLALLFGKLDLALTLHKPLAVRLGLLVPAMGAAYAGPVMVTLTISF